MPKCLLHAVRGYRTGRWISGHDRDPNVMTTRSGLAIQKVSFQNKNKVSAKYSPLKESKTAYRNQQKKQKYPIVKYKSLSYMSFVTRFHISLRVPHLELAGVNPRETLECFDGFPSSNSSERSLPSEYDSESSNEWETDDENEVYLGTCSDDVDLGLLDEAMSGDFMDSTSCQNINDDPLPELDQIDDIQQSNYDRNDNSYFSDSDSDDSAKEFANMCLRDDGDFPLPESIEDATAFSRQILDSGRLRKVTLDVQPDKPYDDTTALRCDDCNKSFTSLSAFSAHLRSHHTKQKNKCDICGKIFTRSWLLKGHTRTHTGERPFKCPSAGCDKAFADKSNLRSHMLIHSVKSKNFSCSRCGRAFAQKRYLHKHMLEVCRLI